MPVSCPSQQDGIYRLPTLTDAVPGGFTFNHFLIGGDEPLLFHTGPKGIFGTVSQAVNSAIAVETLRWASFGHWQADESGALNDWLTAAPHAELAVGRIGTMLSGNDQAIRPPRSLGDGEVLDLGGKRVRWINTPHVPHGWDAGLLFEEATGTLLCGDLFTQAGDASVTTGHIVSPAAALEDMMAATSLTPSTAPTIRQLADHLPSTLAPMHGPTFLGDGTSALLALADDYEPRFERSCRTRMAAEIAAAEQSFEPMTTLQRSRRPRLLGDRLARPVRSRRLVGTRHPRPTHLGSSFSALRAV